MKFHPSVVEKLIYLFENYGGHVDNKKLRAQIERLDLTSYDKKTGDQGTVLVLTEDYHAALTGKTRR